MKKIKTQTRPAPRTTKKQSKKAVYMYLFIAAALVLLYVPFSKKVSTARLRSASQAPLSSGSLHVNKFDWDEQDAKKAMIQPRPQTHYITIDVELEHNLSSGAWLAPAVESYVINSAGTKRAIELVILDNPFEARSYLPHEKANGSLSYLVSDNDRDLKWCYRFTQNTVASADLKDLCIPLNSYNHKVIL